MARALEDQVIEADSSRASDYQIRFESSPRRVRAYFGGVAIADSRDVMMMHETKHLPVYYLPMKDVRMDLMVPTSHRTHCPFKGDASYWTVKVGDRVAENAAWSYENPLPSCPGIKGYFAFYWDKMNAWFEEDDQVYVHPRDPYHRVDVLNSSRHVRVVVAGETVAETRRPRLLFETGLPTRYYIPKLDVRLDLLVPSETSTRCPYKGKASYWSIMVGDGLVKDIVWSYEAPIPECPKIENLLCFFNERADIYVDGELMPKPKTPWS